MFCFRNKTNLKSIYFSISIFYFGICKHRELDTARVLTRTSLDHHKRINFPADNDKLLEFSTRLAVINKNIDRTSRPDPTVGRPDPWTSLELACVKWGECVRDDQVGDKTEEVDCSQQRDNAPELEMSGNIFFNPIPNGSFPFPFPTPCLA